jgi:CelD/BcsL family acetyltransferase involved in cellulose biosynthesis
MPDAPVPDRVRSARPSVDVDVERAGESEPPLVTRVLTAFADAEPVWRQVLGADRTATFFSGHVWQSAWWRHHGEGHRLLLVAVLRAGRPAGLGPFMVGSSAGGSVVRFVGTGLSDYGDLIVDERIASRREVVFAALDAVRARCPEAVLDLEQVPDRSGTVGLLAGWAAERGYRLRCRVQQRCPYQRLPSDADLLDAGRSQSSRRQGRRNTRALERLGPLRLVAYGLEAGLQAGLQAGQEAGLQGGQAGADLAAAVRAMADVERAHPAAERRVNSFEGSRGRFLTDVLAGAAEAGQLWLSGLWVGSTLVAYSVAFEQGGVLYGYLQGYRREYANYSPGTILLLHLQREAIRRRIHTVDYLRGAESYKLRWQTGTAVNRRVLLRPTAVGPVARLTGLAHLVGSCWRDILGDVPGLRGARDHARRLGSAAARRRQCPSSLRERFREAVRRAASYDS